MATFDLNKLNSELRLCSPEEIVRWAVQQSDRVITTSSFSPNSAVTLHLVTQVKPDMVVVWVDSGYNVPDAYRVAEQLIERLKINIQVYTPRMTAARRSALKGSIPNHTLNPEGHAEFTRQVKLEPFQRALDELKPAVWITGIRREETEYRKTLDIVSYDNRGLLRVAPLFHLTDVEIQEYLNRHQLPSCKHYFDPTKVDDNAECGLHTAAVDFAAFDPVV